jgi:hypothetical protein
MDNWILYLCDIFMLYVKQKIKDFIVKAGRIRKDEYNEVY